MGCSQRQGSYVRYVTQLRMTDRDLGLACVPKLNPKDNTYVANTDKLLIYSSCFSLSLFTGIK